MKGCIEIGIIQAFLDGETGTGETVAISQHINECDACASLLAQAEDDSALVYSVLENDLDTLVPTQRLWSRINESIHEEQYKASWWHRLAAILPLQLSGPSMAVAGLLVVFGMFAVIWSVRSVSEMNMSDGVIADSGKPAMPDVKAPVRNTTAESVPEISAVSETEISGPTKVPAAVPARYNTSTDQRRTSAAAPTERPRAMTLRYIPGEESYMRTISDLKQSVDVQKDRVLPPASRVAFERDLAVVNDTIERMQRVVRRDPNNQSAKQLLYSSYQDKIDLLNSVSQREELLASLR